ncbi:MAG: SUMF1/EgtB/PvdO family nonheme iron enzyme [Gemmatimonadetes bacterium]|jgi:formylglycine-generating enzyme|nr:SUMF1/EgtB/PvdO family nonheme iron enzyme [Gemmatimonadota bacterium]MBT7862562.1 SUMF1/EgtB/PvdO family nonheme iron enzyme [Gemmatimonadota bacterium]
MLPTLITIPAGQFTMGSPTGRKNERPVRRVHVDAFRLATTPVTRADYTAFMEATDHPAPGNWDDPRFAEPRQPVVAVTWFEAVAYCDWLTQEVGTALRLPTEAEREKASRGGVDDLDYPWGSELPDWMDPHHRGDDVERPDLVGQDPANGYGLHNMADLVHEWCSDWYDAGYYADAPDTNPLGPEAGVRRASRGGSWRHAIKVTRCAARSSILPDRRLTDYGFRVAADG